MAHWKEDCRSVPLIQIHLEPSKESKKENKSEFHIVKMPLEFPFELIASHLR